MKQASFIAKWSSGTKSRRRIALSGALLAVLGAGLQQGAATIVTFGFGDIDYLPNNANLGTYFPGATGSTGSSGKGYWQETQDAAGGGVIVTKLSNGSGVPGEYVVDTSTTRGLYLNGFTDSTGAPINTVYNSLASIPYFQYKTDMTAGFLTGTSAAFTLVSFQLSGPFPTFGPQNITVEGFVAGNPTVAAFTDTRAVSGNTLSTWTENWSGVTTVEFGIISGGVFSAFGNSDNIILDNVVIDTDVTAVPEAPTLLSGALLLLPFGASTLRILRRNVS